jgi:ABC-type transporter Mla subunit MlaD
MPAVPATLGELEARVAALEAERADYRAVLAAVNALGENQREHSMRLDRVENRLDKVESWLDQLESKLDDTNSGVRSIEENLAEVKDLLMRALAAR